MRLRSGARPCGRGCGRIEGFRDARRRQARVNVDETRVPDDQTIADGELDVFLRGDVRGPNEERRAEVAVLLAGPVAEAADADAERVWGSAPRPGDVGGDALGERVSNFDLDRVGLALDACE